MKNQGFKKTSVKMWEEELVSISKIVLIASSLFFLTDGSPYGRGFGY